MQLYKTGLGMLMAVCASAFALIAPAGAGDMSSGQPSRGVFFSGVDGVKDASYFYDGVIVAWNGDLGRDGVLLRAYGSWLNYDRHPGTGRGLQGDLMVGYGFTRGPMWGSIFVGVDLQDYHLSPDDPTERPRGSETGFKIAGDLSTAEGSRIYAAISANYSTAFDMYWARARLGINRDKLTFGPEGIVLGDVSFDAQRLGGFITFHDLNPFRMRPFDLTFSVGHQFADDNNSGSSGGSDGTYGAIAFSMVF
jgi:Cellulose biosynthesis protein BcsS